MNEQNLKEQMKQALTSMDRPSAFFEKLPDDLFPSLRILETIPQDPVHHPEGNVWIHTMMVVDEAAKLRDRSRDPYSFMLSALLHDIGKAVTTGLNKKGRICAYCHEIEGVPLAKAFLKEYALQEADQEYILNMVKMHMRPNTLVRDHSSYRAFKKMMQESVCPEDLFLLAEADHYGRGIRTDYAEARAWLGRYLERWNTYSPQSKTTEPAVNEPV